MLERPSASGGATLREESRDFVGNEQQEPAMLTWADTLASYIFQDSGWRKRSYLDICPFSFHSSVLKFLISVSINSQVFKE